MAPKRAAARRPAPPPPPVVAVAPDRAWALWVAGVGGALMLGLVQAQILGWPANAASLRLEMLILAAFVGAWAWLWNLGLASSVRVVQALAGVVSGVACMLAVRGSGSADPLDPTVLALYALALAALYLALVGWRPRPQEAEAPGAAAAWAWLLGGSAVLMLGTVAMRAFAQQVLKTPAPSDAIFMFFMPRGASYEGVPGGAPPRIDQWQAVLVFLVAALGALGYLAYALRARLRWMILALMVLGFAGKLNISYFSPSGLEQVGHKIEATGTAYFNLVPAIQGIDGGLKNFIVGFNQKQSRLGTHAETHPFGPEVIYTYLSRLTGHNAYRTGLWVMALLLATFAPVVLMAARYFKDPAAGWAAGAIYLFTPQQLILSGAGTDCMVTLGLAWELYLVQRAVDGRSWRWGALAGLVLFLASMVSSGVLLPMAFVGLWALWLARRADAGPGWGWSARLAWALLPLTAAFLGAHALLWAATGGSFHYAQVLRDAMPVQLDLLRVRPYSVWVWLNPVQIGAYVGWPLVALLLASLWQGLRRADLGDGLLVAAAGFCLLVVLASLGNAESQRMFQYLVLLLLLPAVGFLRRPGPQGPAVDRWLLLALCVLLFINTVALEATVLDYW